MTISELKSLISGIDGAMNARVKNTNFVVVPCEDGIVKVSTSVAKETDGKNYKAFNLEAAVAEYKAWEAEAALKAAEKANKPAKVAGPSPEAQARNAELEAAILALPSFSEYTATDIYNAVNVSFNNTVMRTGQVAKRMVESGVLTTSTREGDKKTYYTKA